VRNRENALLIWTNEPEEILSSWLVQQERACISVLQTGQVRWFFSHSSAHDLLGRWLTIREFEHQASCQEPVIYMKTWKQTQFVSVFKIDEANGAGWQIFARLYPVPACEKVVCYMHTKAFQLHMQIQYSNKNQFICQGLT
jgi:hypothetical protein